MLSCTLILPAAHIDTGNAVSEAMGWGSPAYTVALSPTGTEPATHYGLRTWSDEAFQAMLESQVYPPELADAGITEAAYMAMIGKLVWSFWPDYTGHFDAVIGEQGLKVVGVQNEGE